MHFVGMLAFKLPMHMEYDIGLTMVSVVPAIVCSAGALWIISRPVIGIGLLLLCSIIMGGGIGSMHFMGMAAMEMHAELYYDPVIFGLAVVIAVCLAFGAIFINTKLVRWANGRTRIVAAASAFVMGAATSGMHYTAMEAAHFLPIQDQQVFVNSTSHDYLVVLVGVGAMLVLGLSVSAGIAYRHFAMANQLRDTSKRLEATVKELEFQKFALDQHAIVSIADVKGRITYANSKFCEISGYDADELIGRTHQIVKSDEHPPELFREMWRAIANGKVWHDEIKNRGKDGRFYWVKTTIVPFLDESGKPFKYISIRTDITEQKQAEAELSQAKEVAEGANRAKSAFLATMSHEIRTPMNGIIGMVELLTKTPTNDDQNHMLTTVQDSAFSLLSIINDILDFSKIEAGKFKIEKTPVYVPSLVESVVETLLPIAAAKGVRVKSYVNPWLCPWVLGDQGRIRQILLNLIGNAIKFTESSETGENEVTVTAIWMPDQTDDHVSVLFSITDTGIGMTEEVVGKLFKPFVQGEDSTTRRFGGTGLGLSISKQLVDLMDGTINVESEIDVGTTFNMTLPFESASMGMACDSGFDVSGIRVLLAIEDPDAREIAHSCLSHFDAKVKVLNAPPSMALDDVKDVWSGDVIVTCAEWYQEVRSYVKQAATGVENSRCHFVVLTENQTNLEYTVDTDVLYLNSDPLLGTVLLRTVAIAAGRASPVPLQGHGINTSPLLRERPSLSDAESNGQLILVAEDNETNQDVLLRQLDILGYAAEIVSNGREALDAFRSGRFGLVLTDCHMPEMDGFELTAAIRAAEVGTDCHTPIIAITANALAGEDKRCLDIGMDDFLSKPVGLQNFHKALKKWLPKAPGSTVEKRTGYTQADQSVDMSNAALDGEDRNPIDPTALTKVIGDDPELHRKFLIKFVGPSKETIGQILTAHSERCATDVGDLAHKLKSSARVIGANALADTCAVLEAAGKDKDWPRIDELVPEMDVLMGEVETYVLAI